MPRGRYAAILVLVCALYAATLGLSACKARRQPAFIDVVGSVGAGGRVVGDDLGRGLVGAASGSASAF